MSFKSRVRFLMEKFESGGRDAEDDLAHSQPLKIPKTEVPEGIQHARKAALEKAAQESAMCTEGPSTSSVSYKPSLVVKPLACDETENKQKQPHLNTVAQVFGVYLQPVNRENNEKSECTKFPIKTCCPAKEDPKSQHPKPAWNKFPSSVPPSKEKNTLGAKPKSDLASQKSEARTASSKVSVIKEKLMPAAQENVPKPSLIKKPSFNTKVSNNKSTSNKCDSLQSRLSGPRTNTHSLMKVKEMGENNSAAEAAGSHLPKIDLQPAGHSRTSLQGTFRNVKQETEEKAMSVIKTTVPKKVIQEGSDSSHKFCKTNTALGAVRSSDKTQKKGDDAPRPRQRVLAPEFKTSTCPAKPSRPPSVELQGYQRRSPKKIRGNEGVKLTGSFVSASLAPLQDRATQFPSPKPKSHPDLEVMEAPSLPPRNIKPSSPIRNPENEENYDDVEFVSQGHGSTQGDQEGDVEMYEDINDIRSSREKGKKQNKEDKRRMEQEKREQKEKEKKELELRKKFKLVGPIEVLHQARACVDHKGGKNELTVKQGDKIEIIRLTDNPEGKWLGRIGGCCGYIKTTMVEIDYDSLKRKQQTPTGADVKFSESDMEVYDDVGQEESSTSLSADNSGAGNVFPFPPPPSNEDIYDEIGDGEPIASTSSSTNLSGKDCGEDVYDDVDSSDFSPPLPDAISLNLESFGKRKLDKEDVQKREKMEKEEKQFKHVGEIKVLFSTTTIQNLPKRKWGSKELHIKPGESLDIIESTDDTKVLCRNKERKYGYVLRSNLVQKHI